MTVREYLSGIGRYTVTGADPESCLNRLSAEGLFLWDIVRSDPLTYTFSAYLKAECRILSVCECCYCHGECTHKKGMGTDLKRLLSRPMLILSLTAAMLLTFLLEGLIWKIHIDAEDPEIALKISHTLRDLGVDIWTRTKDLEPRELRYNLLNTIPELSWVAVNPKGGKLTVLATVKESTENQSHTSPGNLIACREGIITESVVLEGMPLVKIGQSVRSGQILVSGVEDYGLYLKAVRAEGELYGQTWYSGTLVTPSTQQVKQYTGRIFKEINLIVGRKFINLQGSSSILGVTCDKMIDTEQFSLLGCPFPLYLQRVTYREYTTKTEPIPREQATELLFNSWDSCLRSSMVAGRVEHTDYHCFEEGGLYTFCGESICHELLSRFMELAPLMKGEDPIGTDH